MGRPKLSRQTNFSGANGKGKNAYSAKNEQDWQPYPVDPYSAESADHTYLPRPHPVVESHVCSLRKSADYHLGFCGLFIPPLCLTLVLDLLPVLFLEIRGDKRYPTTFLRQVLHAFLYSTVVFLQIYRIASFVCNGIAEYGGDK